MHERDDEVMICDIGNSTLLSSSAKLTGVTANGCCSTLSCANRARFRSSPENAASVSGAPLAAKLFTTLPALIHSVRVSMLPFVH